MGKCKMKGKTRCSTGRLNKKTGKIIFCNMRVKHGKPKQKVIDQSDRPLLSKSFAEAMNQQWFRREVEHLVNSGEMTQSEIYDKVNETITHNRGLTEIKKQIPKGSTSILENPHRRKRNAERLALGITMKQYRKLQKKQRQGI